MVRSALLALFPRLKSNIILGFPTIRGPFWGSYNSDYTVPGSVLGFPSLWKRPFMKYMARCHNCGPCWGSSCEAAPCTFPAGKPKKPKRNDRGDFWQAQNRIPEGCNCRNTGFHIVTIKVSSVLGLEPLAPCLTQDIL